MESDLTEVKREEIRRMFASIVHRYDLINRLLSFRRDVYWRRAAVTRGQVPQGGRALDLCAGTADVALEVVRQVPRAQVIAVDNCEPMLLRGLLKARGAGVADRVRFVAAPAELLPFPDDVFDGAFVAFGIRNVADWRRGLGEMARVLKPGGRVVILEFSTPPHLSPGPCTISTPTESCPGSAACSRGIGPPTSICRRRWTASRPPRG